MKGHKEKCPCSFCKAKRGEYAGENHPTKNPEVRKKISKALKGRKFTNEWRLKQSKAHIGKKGFWTGKKRPDMSGDNSPTKRDDVKKKIGDANRKYEIEPELLWGYYWGAELGAKEISKMLKCNREVIYRNMDKYNIPRRTNSESHIGIPFDVTNHRENCFCSVCKAKRGEHSGENNPQWRGGISFEPYGLEFNNDLKEKIRERDNWTCQECGIHQDNLDEHLCIHHIDYDKKNNSEDNLISLCRSCHAQTNFSRNDWTKYFMKRLKV